MRNILLFILFNLSFIQSTKAQKPGLRFSSTTSVGIVTGESESALIIETINGIKFSKWFAGVGAGLDYYQYNSLPIFVNGRRYFDKSNRAFVYGNAGFSIPLKNVPKPELGFFTDYYFSGGIYAGGGVAYSLPLKNRTSMTFSIGYSYKELEMHSNVKICGIIPPCREEQSRYDLNYGMIVIKMGIGF